MVSMMDELNEVLGTESAAPRKRVSRSLERVEGRNEKKSLRTPLGVARQKLSYRFRDPAMATKFYLYNALEENVDTYLDNGYEYVTKDEVILPPGAHIEGKDLGSRLRQKVGRNDDGSPLYGYLLKLPMELRKEDEAAMDEHNKELYGRQVSAAVNVGPTGFVDSRTRIG